MSTINIYIYIYMSNTFLDVLYNIKKYYIYETDFKYVKKFSFDV